MQLKSTIPAIVLLLLLPLAASANHGVEAIGYFIYFLIAVAGFMALNFLIAIINVAKKKKTLSIINIMFLTPQFLLFAFLLGRIPNAGLIGLLFVLIQGILIYKGYPSSTRDEKAV